jgi:hypothetical protein
VTTNFPGFPYQFSDNWNGYSWSDGTPQATVSDTTTGVYAVGAGHGFHFTVPAGPAIKTLQVFVGAYGAGGKFQAALSDNSAPSYLSTTLSNAANGPSGFYTLTFAGRSPGSRLSVRWTVAAMADPSFGNVTLQAATLTSTNAQNPPFVTLTSPLDNATLSAGSNLSLAATAADYDGTIARVEFFHGATKIGEDVTSPFNVIWNSVAPGSYILTAQAEDNDGQKTVSPPVEVFVHGTGGSLIGSLVRPPSLPIAVNLTTEGTGDWIHWGGRTSSSADRKAGVVPQISDVTLLADRGAETFGDNYTGFTWTDGIPTAQMTNDKTGIYVPGLTNGFDLGFPADRNSRTVKIYVGLYAAQGRFQAWLTDFSARAYASTSLSNFYGNDYGAYTLTYAAASAGQVLRVRYTSRDVFDFDFGNVTLQAASMAGQPVSSNPLPVTLISPRWIGNDFVFSFSSAPGARYSAQFSPSLAPSAWQAFATLTGSGDVVHVTNNGPNPTSRFFRIESR